MNLSDFITGHLETILSEWEAFARTQLPAAEGMTSLALRNHGEHVLRAIARDIRKPQSDAEQYRKSLGERAGDPDSAASTHGTSRLADRFSLQQLFAEYRALRATVLRLWLPLCTHRDDENIDDVVRLGEAIDQAIADSIEAYSAGSEREKHLFLAVLGHDLRAPLTTMGTCGELLASSSLPARAVSEVGAKVGRATYMMRSMVDDLLGYTRCRLGQPISIERTSIDARQAVENAVTDASSVYPRCSFIIDCSTPVSLAADPVRIHQLLINLLINACQHGTEGHPVNIAIAIRGQYAVFSVNNTGPVIPESAREHIFDPLTQLPADPDASTQARTSLGLGLYIARAIAIAHGGSLTFRSEPARGTTFIASLPRHAAATHRRRHGAVGRDGRRDDGAGSTQHVAAR